MQLEIIQYKMDAGWSVNSFSELDSENTLILNFFSPEYINNLGPFKELKKAYPKSIIAGCSTSGEILDNEIFDKSICSAIMRFDKSKIKMFTLDIHEPSQSSAVGQQLAKNLQAEDLKAIFILSDGLVVNGSALIHSLRTHLDPETIITGGLAGDGKDFKKTFVLKDGLPASQCVSAIGFYGDDIVVNYGSQGGWDIFGPERHITKSKDNILYEIDGQPALALYKKYLGDQAKELPASGLQFPLAISRTPFSKAQVVRTILAINEEDQSMTFAGDIPEGWYAQLMRANFDRLVEGAMIAGQLAKPTFNENTNTLAIAISCVGRRLVLGERSEEEIEATHDMLGNDMPLVGFYSYGEISPSLLGSSDLHNQTMTLTTFGER
ncbi:MAG: FIST signal transduction protein [Candidatus Berkiella sp.]